VYVVNYKSNNVTALEKKMIEVSVGIVWKVVEFCQ